MLEPFPIVDATSWEIAYFEPEGSDEKAWLIDPTTGGLALFKPNARNDDAERADHWPEKLASELADRLGIPHARIDLAVREDRRGCLSYNVVPRGWSINAGYVLLAAQLGNHDPMKPAGHSLENVRAVLHGYDHPPGFTGQEDFDAFDVFTGYLVLDALIANRDRHPANWSVLLGAMGERALAPSYDHATSLGFNLLDAKRERMFVDQQEWEAFLRKGSAHRFEGCEKVPLTDLALQALTFTRCEVREYWQGRVSGLREDRIEALTQAIPEMSESARRFAVRLVVTNRGRLLDG